MVAGSAGPGETATADLSTDNPLADDDEDISTGQYQDPRASKRNLVRALAWLCSAAAAQLAPLHISDMVLACVVALQVSEKVANLKADQPAIPKEVIKMLREELKLSSAEVRFFPLFSVIFNRKCRKCPFFRAF